jgi:peptidyl-tRNA hydrolase
MNLSGKAVHYWMDKENIPLENILVITDDLNLSFGNHSHQTKEVMAAITDSKTSI